MARIAHISDIHFGRSFHVDVWNRVKDEIVGLQPKTIIASGDFTDDPDPLLLLAAKSELQDLCKRCGEGTEFFVVPGNHDLLDLGNFLHPGSAKWFDRVMFHDTTSLRRNLESKLGFELGLNAETLRWAKFPRLRRMWPRNWLSVATWTDTCDGRLQSCDYRRAGKRWPTRSIHDRTLITCLNSNNPSLRQFVFATGTIGKHQIERIMPSNLLAACPCCRKPANAVENGGILLRVAVLHHHPMPIAVRDISFAAAKQEARLEPFLILKNSGDLVHELQSLKFDVILHGHKHRSQVARVDLGADHPDRYPILVLAGGSTAKEDETPPNNTLRDIETEANGRLNVRTFWQGKLQEERNFREPIEILKRRAFARAVDRTGIFAHQWISDVVIDEVGHLRSLDTTSKLRVKSKDVTLAGLVSHVDLASHDIRLDVELEEGSDRVSLSVRDDADRTYHAKDEAPADSFYWVNFHEALKANQQPLTFSIREAAANSMAMSQWEIEQRSRHRGGAANPDYGYEEVGSNVSYPIERLTIRVTFPPGFESITPRPRCRRYPSLPDFPLRYLREQRPRPDQARAQLISDGDLAREEMRGLTYDAKERKWVLEIDYPIPGCSYSLQWRVPNPRASQKVCDRSTAYRKMLARLFDGSCGSETVKKCQERFNRLARNLMLRFRFGYDATEKQTAFLMLYEPEHLRLRPALRQGPIPEGNYDVPFGGGVAGAAFLQRQIIAWKNDPNSESLIRPASSGALNSHWVLALPVFHQGGRNATGDELDTEPGAVLAVITLGSDSAASRISECAPSDDDPEGEMAEKIGQEAQILAQQCVFDILGLLGNAGGQADPVVPVVP